MSSVLATLPDRMSEMNAPGAHAILWAVWRSAASLELWPIFLSWMSLGVTVKDANVMDVLLMEAEWSKKSSEEE